MCGSVKQSRGGVVVSSMRKEVSKKGLQSGERERNNYMFDHLPEAC